MLDQLTCEDFESLRGRTVEIRFGETRQPAEVVEVQRRTGGAPEGRSPFSVIVESGSRDRCWPQGLHVLAHPEHGDLELFMVPLGPGDAGMRYEIVMN